MAGIAGAVPCTGHRLCVNWNLSHLLLSQARPVCACGYIPAPAQGWCKETVHAPRTAASFLTAIL